MPVKQGLASLEDGFRVRYLGSLGFANGSKTPRIQTLQRPMLQLYSAARRRGEDRRSTHSLALTQFLDVSDYGLVVVDIEEDPEDGELSPVITKVITPVQNIVLWAAVRFHTRPTKRKSMGAAFVPIACSDGVLDKNAFIQLGNKQRFLVSLTHPPLFVCLLQRVANPKSIECHAFVCSTAEDALSISSMVGGSKEERGPTGTLGYFSGPKSHSHTFKSSRDPSHSEEDLLSTSTITPSSITTATEATSSRMTVDSSRVSRAHYANGHSRNETKYQRSRSCPRPAADESSLDYAEFKRDHVSPSFNRRELSPLNSRRMREPSPVLRREMSPLSARRDVNPVSPSFNRRELSPLNSRRMREPSPVLRREMSPLSARREATPVRSPVAGRGEHTPRRREFSPVLGRRDEQSPIIERRGENGGAYHDSPVLGRRFENGFNDQMSQTPKLSKRFVQSKFYDKKSYSPPKPPKRRSKSLGRHVATSSPDFSGDNSDLNSYRNEVTREDPRNSNHIASLGTPPKRTDNRPLPSYQFGQHEKSFQTNSSEQSTSPASPNSSEESASARKPREMVTMSHTVDFSSEGEGSVRNSYLTKNSVRKREEKSRYRRDVTQFNGSSHSLRKRTPSPPKIRDAFTMTELPKQYKMEANSDPEFSDDDRRFPVRNGQQSEGTQTNPKRAVKHQDSHIRRSQPDLRMVNDNDVSKSRYVQKSDESDSDRYRLGIRVEPQREYAVKMGDSGLYRMIKESRETEYKRQRWQPRREDVSSDSEANEILDHPKYLRNTEMGVWVPPSYPNLDESKRSSSAKDLVSSGTQTRVQYVNSNVRYEEERDKVKDSESANEIMGNGTSRVTITVPYVNGGGGSRVSDSSYAQSGASFIPHGVRSYHRRDQVRNWSTVSVTSDQSYQGSSTLPLAKTRHHQQNKVIRWSSVEDMPRRRGFLTTIKRFSVRSLTRAKKKTGKLLNSLKSRMKSDKPRGEYRNTGDATYNASEVCLRPDGNRQNALKKKKKRQQSWSFHDLRTEFPAGRPTRRRRCGSQDDLLERNGSPGGSGNSNNSARELISRKKKRNIRYDGGNSDESSDSGVEEYPSDYSDALAAARSRRSKSVPQKFPSDVPRLTVESPSSNNTRKKRNNGRWSQTDLHGELGYIP